MNKTKGLIVILALALCLIFGASVFYRMNNPELEIVQNMPPANAQGGMPDMGNMVGALMQKLQDNPNDISTIITLAEAFLNSEQFDKAESFAKRALAIEPNNLAPQFLLAVSLQAQGKNEESIAVLENIVKNGDDMYARYNLAMIYGHFLNDRQKAKENLEKALVAPNLSGVNIDELKAAITEELANYNE